MKALHYILRLDKLICNIWLQESHSMYVQLASYSYIFELKGCMQLNISACHKLAIWIVLIVVLRKVSHLIVDISDLNREGYSVLKYLLDMEELTSLLGEVFVGVTSHIIHVTTTVSISFIIITTVATIAHTHFRFLVRLQIKRLGLEIVDKDI